MKPAATALSGWPDETEWRKGLMEQAVFISPGSFTGRPWHFPKSACIPYCRCPLELECHGFPCVTSFQPAISHCLWESRCSPSNKVTLPFGICCKLFPSGRQIAGVRALNTAGVYQRNGQCRASARPEEERFCSRHCHKYGKRNDRLILEKLTRQKQFAIQSI